MLQILHTHQLIVTFQSEKNLTEKLKKKKRQRIFYFGYFKLKLNNIVKF